MLKNEDQWVELADAFANAALDGEGWYRALEMLGEATGSANGQLICLGPEAPQNNIWTVDPAIAQAFYDEGFSDPRNNPRIRAGMASRPGTILADADFITPEQARHDPSYQWGWANGQGFICLSTLMAIGTQSLVGLAVNRGLKEGHISASEKEVFASITHHVRSAVRMQMMLEGNTAKLLVGAMESMSIAAFAFNRSGRVIALSSPAEALLSQGRFLSVKNGYLNAEVPSDAQELSATIRSAAVGIVRPGSPLLKSMFLRSLRSTDTAAPHSSLLVDIISLPPKAFSFGFAPQALLVVRGNGQDEPLLLALKAGYGLTEGEARVAVQLAKGLSPEQIAIARSVSVGTVRTQVKSVYDKLDVHRQGDLIARLRP